MLKFYRHYMFRCFRSVCCRVAVILRAADSIERRMQRQRVYNVPGSAAKFLRVLGSITRRTATSVRVVPRAMSNALLIEPQRFCAPGAAFVASVAFPFRECSTPIRVHTYNTFNRKQFHYNLSYTLMSLFKIKWTLKQSIVCLCALYLQI